MRLIAPFARPIVSVWLWCSDCFSILGKGKQSEEIRFKQVRFKQAVWSKCRHYLFAHFFAKLMVVDALFAIAGQISCAKGNNSA